MLYLVVFVTNAAILVFEIAGARLLAPYLGTSVEVWAGTIAVILGGMAVGYWVGGILADKYPSRKILALLLFGSALAALLAWGVRDLIPTLFAGEHALPLTFTAILTAALLFAPTTILLAAVSPFVAKALITALESSARVVGRLNAIGTVGSIAGAIASSSLLIPYFGLDVIMLGIAVTLVALSLLVATDRFKGKVIVLLVVGAFAFGFDRIPVMADEAIADISTTYNRIWVMERTYAGQDLLTIQTDPFGIQCSQPLDGGGPAIVFSYLKGFDLVAHAAVSEGPTRALFLGGCNYSYPRAFLDSRPNAKAVVVEIDPGMTAVAEAFFNFDPAEYPSLSIVHADARRFLDDDEAIYDIIFMDVFGSSSNTPHHLTTAETFALLAERAGEKGALVINIISPYEGEASRFAASMLATARTAFPTAELYTLGSTYPTIPQNLLLVASNATEFDSVIHDPRYTDVVLRKIDATRLPEGMVLTDDYAPVEYLTREIRSISF